MDGNLGLRAEDDTPRNLAPRDSGRPNRVRTRREVRLVGPALCRLKYNSVEEPTQASTTRHVRSEPRQLVVHLPASCSAFDLHRCACSRRVSRHRLSTIFFGCFRPARNYAPGQAYWNRDGIMSNQESPFCRFAEGPTGSRANLGQESGRSSRDIIGTTGAGPGGLIIASAPVVRA